MTYRSINPFTEEVLAEFPEHTPAELEGILSQADSTHRHDWALRSYQERGGVVGRAGDLLAERREEFARLATTEMGKRYEEALFEVDRSVDILRYFATQAEVILADRDLQVPEGAARMVARSVGVVFCIEPWNFPYIQLARVAGPIMMAGNTVVMKHAPSVPRCALAFEALFVDAGAPAGLYSNVFLTNEQSATVIEDPRVRAVSLTGSERAGESVAATAGRALKKVSLELGGSDAFIVLDDAELDLAVDLAVAGRMMNTGQACGGSKRFIVHSSLYEQFTERFVGALEALVPGDPMEPGTGVGPLVNEAALARVQAQIELATANGATIATGGGRIDRTGFFLEPTVLTGVTADNPVFRQEFFAPVAMVFEAASEDDAIALANDSDYGLGGSVVSSDPVRAARVAERMESGMVFINHLPDSAPNLPWGGVKRSGFGRELSDLGLGEFVNWRLLRSA